MASKSRKVTEAEARAEAKAKAQAELKAKERRTTVIIVAVSLVVIAALAGVIYFIVDSSKTPSIGEVATPAGADETGGILVGSADGAHRADVYLDFMCPYCGHFEEINGDVLQSSSESGDLAVYYHPLAFLDRYSSGTKYSSRAANAAAVVADRDPEHFSAFFEAMFANQPAENSTGLSDEEISQIAVGVGVPQDVADAFKDGEFADWVAAASQQASIDGVGGTPTFMIDRAIVEQTHVPYMNEGVLESYLTQLASS